MNASTYKKIAEHKNLIIYVEHRKKGVGIFGIQLIISLL
jgi:hypothetical protein